VDVFAAGEERLEADAVGVAGGQVAGVGLVVLGRSGGVAEGAGACGVEPGLDGPLEGGAGAGPGVVVVQDGDVKGKPVLTGGLGLEEAFEEGGGAAGLPPFAVVVGEAEGGDGIVRVVAEGELELAEGEVEEAGVFAEEAPVGVAGADVTAGADGLVDVGEQGGVGGGGAEAVAEDGEEVVGHGMPRGFRIR
jgi:hypothetical protein